MITLSERAAREVKRIFQEHHMPADACLRVGIKGGGCSGFSYVLDVATRPAEDDQTFDAHGVKIVCDPKSYLYLAGTEVDYDEAMLGKGFVFNNPNAKSRCGCGLSFRA
jgi:iron-sulfur cluster assembly protein